MNAPDHHRRTLAQEFRDSFRAGPRAWYVAIIIVLSFTAFPVVGFFGFIFAVLFLLPAIFGAALGRVVSAIRDQRTVHRLERSPRTTSVMSLVPSRSILVSR